MMIQALLAKAKRQLTESGSDSPSLDATLLLCHVLQKPRSYLLTWPDKVLSPNLVSAFEALLARRIVGEPIAYIIGEREFWSLPLKVAPSTLIPRPDTERLVELALDKAVLIDGDILDLGTGTGAIALALASELPQRHVLGIDLRSEAVELAEDNRKRLQLSNVTFLQGSWFTPLANGIKFALIASNPPYIEEHDPHLQQGDVRFEPRSALVAGDNGLADIKHIATSAREYLLDQGWLLFEHGYQQGKAVRTILSELGYQQVVTEQDYAGNDRVTLGQCRF
ncbi:peptide chain release factor N(5)-glutamine methyltransferase [Vibrio metschnikovii]|uniref:Release factor glutamine methyltransferase n=1 Tax=bacterium 19MO02SH05 TaxID=2920696 RepID=A0AAU6TKM1_UNCXX|nr:peptide chain release factor N(5)-glutamine methyltransferase [Vibrio metschnikovii]EKO3716308.1 peptide chain release factor N(5)-glutamine methyltransferase [Vibrio metschnikovii]EKO3734812.1 peptide chain release factor N(5)-glutamine methyltransferase [Vibrio metschnikovii]EKO3744464.1 peptide chain release factor N(5)-glutamine methyltransferase [Vibrio metschnikovii]